MTTVPDDFLKALVDNAPPTWTEVGRRIAESGFQDPWKELGVWATTALSNELGDEWPKGFLTKNDGRPLIPTLLAPMQASYIFRLAEIGLQLNLLRDQPGISRVRADMVGPPTEDSWGHSLLVLSVAAMELRRSGRVKVELPSAAGNWTPDVALAEGTRQVLVECFRMVVGAAAKNKAGFPAGDDAASPIDEWRRVGARLVDKAGQVSQQRGWLRCELDSGIFHNIDWYEHSLGTGSLEEKLTWLAERLRESLQHSGELAGVVVSSPPMQDVLVSPEGDCLLEDGSRALVRRLAGERSRETFIVPIQETDRSAEVDVWHDLYSEEPTWINWALATVGQATV